MRIVQSPPLMFTISSKFCFRTNNCILTAQIPESSFWEPSVRETHDAGPWYFPGPVRQGRTGHDTT